MKSIDTMAWALAATRTKKLYKKRKYKKALDAAHDTMKKAIKAFGEEHINTSRTAYNLVLLNSHFENYEEAEKYALMELKIMEDIKGVDSYDTIDEIRILEELYRKWGKIEKADELEARINRIIDEDEKKSEETDEEKKVVEEAEENTEVEQIAQPKEAETTEEAE